MPEDNEKVEDFITLWRKKMETEIKKPSAIGETLDKMKEMEEENESLRNKIKQNIELITRTEKIIKSAIDENERLKAQLQQAGSTGEIKVSNIQQENIELNNKVISLEKDLTEKEVELQAKNHEIIDLKTKLDVASRSLESMSDTITDTSSELTTTLIDDLKSELIKKKSQIEELEKKIDDLNEQNQALKKELIDKMKKLPIDYVIPVESPKPSESRPQSTQHSAHTLEILCQDLQSDLNKYKRIVDKLNKEKSELESAIEGRGIKLKPDELKVLKKENEVLKDELSKVQKSLQNNKSQKTDPTPQISELENSISELQEQLNEKDRLLLELKTQEQPQPIVHNGPMSDLVEDLQSKINKLKITIDEKNKIIESLKSS
ncbi:MAG: hypothetical protein ACFFDY_09470 [Candidatus Thorarchaeota archaeon]